MKRKIAIATAIERLNETLIEKINNKYTCEIVLYRGYLIEHAFDIVILSSRLDGEEDLETTFLELIKQGKRIIFLTTSDNEEEKRLCIKYGVFDIIFDSLKPSDIIHLIENPKSVKEMSHVIETLREKPDDNNESKTNSLKVEIVDESINQPKSEPTKKNIVHKINKLTKKNSLLDVDSNELNGKENNTLDKMNLYKEGKKEPKEDIERPVVTIIKDKIIGTLVIAVTGSMQRIGTTHTCISIASYLKSLNQSVGVVEMHESDNFSILRNAYEDVIEKEKGFLLNGFHFYSYEDSINFFEILHNDFNYIVLDMGDFKTCNKTEFLRANIRIVVSGVKDWEIPNLDQYLKEKDLKNKSKYYFTFSNKELFKFVKYNLSGLECYMAPFTPDPFTVDENEVFSSMLKDVIPTNTMKKKKRLFNIWKGGIGK
ncbi:hypothetical protein HZI73_26195 (plasmid) [Vallitalea pronyensis]|uniref:Uncharacterized protein n=1 Tax=Vallitalea pronyensis TaxID=1348613 RepID=A0A8J8MQG2_9FIRM|nr:hypothetical protein [Vallitalea pronyensis]QUI25906.1 hypothetical protein HZI73_26195 [Vallitalea pronyensis]